jgi:endonuclease-8
MPEGDTLYRTAVTLRKALAGRTVTAFTSTVDTVAAMDSAQPLAGRVVAAVESCGKHLLIVFRKAQSQTPIKVPDRLPLSLMPADLVLHTHLRMTGSWHIYRPGEAWRKPAGYAKAVIATDAFVAPCFSAPLVELLTARETARRQGLITLGPDAIAEDFDATEARNLLRRRGDLPIGVAIMDQQAMAGVGNVFKSEVLFIRRLSPFAPVRTLADQTLAELIAEARKLLLINRTIGNRRTVFRLDERQRLWVYGRSGEPCRVCGAVILMERQGYDGRSTYYCPECQDGRTTETS